MGADISATGATPEMAIQRLMDKLGYNNYTYSFGNTLQINETTDGTFETNIVTTGTFGARRRACINTLWDATRGINYYRAWFGLLD